MRGASSIVTAEVKLTKLTLNMNIGEFYRWMKQAEFYADAYLVVNKPKEMQQQMLIQHLDLTLSNMVTTMLNTEST